MDVRQKSCTKSVKIVRNEERGWVYRASMSSRNFFNVISLRLTSKAKLKVPFPLFTAVFHRGSPCFTHDHRIYIHAKINSTKKHCLLSRQNDNEYRVKKKRYSFDCYKKKCNSETRWNFGRVKFNFETWLVGETKERWRRVKVVEKDRA